MITVYGAVVSRVNRRLSIWFYLEIPLEYFLNYREMEDTIDRMNKYDCSNFIGTSIVKLNIRDIDKLWKGSIFYIPNTYKNIVNKNKYNNTYADILNGLVDKPPVIVIDDDCVLKFLDGANTFAVFRDNGYLEIPFIILDQQLELIRKYYI
jgi:hypothetical protein